MKAIILSVALLLAAVAHSQSLKDALYGGKLKADTGAVLKKGDSLKIKENQAQKIIDDSVKKVTLAIEKQQAIEAGKDTTAVVAATVDGSATDAVPVAKETPKDNNKLWKTFIDELSAAIKSEVMTSGKVKSGTYSVLIDYEIGTDGQVDVKSVTADPKSPYLEDQIKERIRLGAPQLNPMMGTNNKPRVVSKKQLLSFTK